MENEWDGEVETEGIEGPCRVIARDELENALYNVTKVKKKAGPSGVVAKGNRRCILVWSRSQHLR